MDTTKNRMATAALSGKHTDVRVAGLELYLLPVATRVPLKFGHETLTSVTCARVRLTVEGHDGRRAEGWGETPLSVQWAWPSSLDYRLRHEAMLSCCRRLAEAWAHHARSGHPLEIGWTFQQQVLGPLIERFNREQALSEPLPYLAALVCCAAFDIALHDAFGNLHEVSTYQTYGPEFMSADLAHFLAPVGGEDALNFGGVYPQSFLRPAREEQLLAWHLVGGLDPLSEKELDGSEPRDGHPIVLSDWIDRDGLRCLKIKLRGDDGAWDLERLRQVGQVAREHGVEWLTADFNCTVHEPQYVIDILGQLERNEPWIHARLLYVEQPFPYELERHAIDVHELAALKPLLMDESAHDWQHVRLGRALGWNGVALKTCKTQTGALLSLCWAKAHGMHVMVQDLTNPMLAQIPHVLLAAHADTMMGVETNSMQFYPQASAAEAVVHPGLYQRRNGRIDLSSLRGPGFGYRVREIARKLPPPAVVYG